MILVYGWNGCVITAIDTSHVGYVYWAIQYNLLRKNLLLIQEIVACGDIDSLIKLTKLMLFILEIPCWLDVDIHQLLSGGESSVQLGTNLNLNFENVCIIIYR